MSSTLSSNLPTSTLPSANMYRTLSSDSSSNSSNLPVTNPAAVARLQRLPTPP
ncbi:hypothetical protein BGZ98_002887, partial [Dissophora globulifera]